MYNLADLASGPLDLGWLPSVATRFDPLRGDGLLAYYLALPVVWVGASPTLAVKAIFALAILMGAVGVYLWLYKSLGARGAVLAALVYTYLPFKIGAVLVRGAWGEALFWGLLPLSFAAVTTSTNRRLAQRLTLAGLAWALLAAAQAGLAVWALICLIVFVLIAGGGSSIRGGLAGRRLLSMLLVAIFGAAVGILLTLWAGKWIIPYSYVNFFDHFLYPSQLLSAQWGFGASRPGWNDGLSLGFGFALVGLAALTLMLWWGRTAKRDKNVQDWPVDDADLRGGLETQLRGWLILSLLLTFLLLFPSAFLWRFSGLYLLLTYPWQLLGLIGLFLAALAGAAVCLEKRLSSLPMLGGLILLTLLASYSYLEPRFVQFSPGSGPLASWDEAHVMLLQRDMLISLPAYAAGLNEATEGRVPMTDYGAPSAGDTLHFVTTWQATRAFDKDLKLFVHLLDESNNTLAQADPLLGINVGPDSLPFGSATSQWDPGELIVSEVPITLPAGLSPGIYHLAFGLYDGESLERLPLDGGEENQVKVDVAIRQVFE